MVIVRISRSSEISLQSVNGTADRPALVLYSPAVTSTDCTGIAMGLWIAAGLHSFAIRGAVDCVFRGEEARSSVAF